MLNLSPPSARAPSAPNMAILPLTALVTLSIFVPSLGCIWSPLAKAVSVPTVAVPSIFGNVVEAVEPSGTSAAVT